MKYKAVYKCRLCGKKFGETIGLKNSKIKAMSFGKQIFIVDNCLNANAFDIRNQHDCEDGSIGFADFQGIVKINED